MAIFPGQILYYMMSGLCNLHGIHIKRRIVFYFQCKCRNARVFDKIFTESSIFIVRAKKIQFLLLKNLSQISLHILLKSLILSCCRIEPVSSGKKLLASERVFVLFLFGWNSGRYAGFNTVE